MKLPVIRVVGNERWDCQECGVCCRGSIIPLTQADLQNIREQRWEDDAEFSGQRLLVRHARAESGQRLAQHNDGRCVFLTAAGRCRIHEKFGAEAKPLVCRLFPLQLIPRDQYAVLTLRRACPSAAADEGRPLTAHLPGIQRLAAPGELAIPRAEAATSDQPTWPRANCILGAVARIFNDERFPPVRRVVHALLLARLLERARLARIDDRKLAELVEMLEPEVVLEAKSYFADRQTPHYFGRMLFRLVAADYVRLHPEYRAPSGIEGRVRLVRAIWKMLRGRGAMPALHPTFPPAAFATLEEPLGTLNPALISLETLRPIERYLATSATSYQYALANRSRWTIFQSIRGLAMTFPIALYLLRWATAGREATAADAVKIACALDRGQGYVALAGRRQRVVLNQLSRHGDLERLVVWYAR